MAKKKDRDYDKEYDDYHSTPEQKKKRAQRNAARAKVQAKRKASGDKPLTKDEVVDHKKPLRKGGTNDEDNLKVKSRKKNAGWRKGKKDYD